MLQIFIGRNFCLRAPSNLFFSLFGHCTFGAPISSSPGATAPFTSSGYGSGRVSRISFRRGFTNFFRESRICMETKCT